MASRDAKAVQLKTVPSELTKETLIQIHDLMVKARVLEERLIKMSKSGQGYFWIGGPGEEAFNVPLGLLIKKGEGLDYDYLHFHYRQSATLMALGSPMIDTIRQMATSKTDPFSGGRIFINHYAIKKWNVAYVTSPIETQFSMAIGTGVAQARHGGDAITIVTGGDAGTAEGDFASCLVWASRADRELPMLMIVTNNGVGISTRGCEVRTKKPIAARGDGFGIKNKTINGNDPIESFREIQAAMAYVRKERKPFLLEVFVSRLNGHSSASGANRVTTETDCLADFEKYLVENKVLAAKDFERTREKYENESLEALQQAISEGKPEGDTIFNNVFVNREEASDPCPRWLKR